MTGSLGISFDPASVPPRRHSPDGASPDHAEVFRSHIQSSLGYAPPCIIGDGKIQRFSTSRNRRDDAGWYVFYNDEFPAGAFGDWRSGEDRGKWSSYDARDLSPVEQERLRLVQEERERRRAAEREEATAKARQLWDRSPGARAAHPYLTAKRIAANGVKESDGKLLVPVTDGERIVSLQFIPGDGDKKFFPGAPTAGGFFMLVAPGETIVIAEGFATGATIREVTGFPVAVAFNAGNLVSVAQRMREKHPTAKIVIAADDDFKKEAERGFNTGKREATKAAEAVGGIVVAPQFDREAGEDGTDFNDLAALRGAEAVKSAFAAPAEAPIENPLAGFTFDGEGSIEPPPMLVKRLVPLEGICFIGGQSGAGKTFIAIDLAVSLASGEPFFGYKVKERVGVAIFAAEGAATIPLRVHVARNEKAQGEILPVAWLGAVPNLSDKRELPGIVERLKAVDARFRETHGARLGAVILDTLAATFDLDDEDNNSEAAKTIRLMKTIGAAAGVVMIPVHHYGKGQETGLRGASGWRAGCDAVLSVLADRNQIKGSVSNRSLALSKSRAGEEGAIAPFEFRFVKVDEDEDGEDVGACVIEMTTTAADAAGAPNAKLSRAARAYRDAFQVAVLDKGHKVRPFGADGPEVNAADREDVRAEFYRSWPADGDTEAKRAEARRKRFRAGELEAIDRRLVMTTELGGKQLVWNVKD